MSELVKPEHLSEVEQEWLARWRDAEGAPAQERVALLNEDAAVPEALAEAVNTWQWGDMEPDPVVDEARRVLLAFPVLGGYFTPPDYDGAVNEFYALRLGDEGEGFGFCKFYDGDVVAEEFHWQQPGHSDAYAYGQWVTWETGTSLREALRTGAEDYSLFEGLDS